MYISVWVSRSHEADSVIPLVSAASLSSMSELMLYLSSLGRAQTGMSNSLLKLPDV